MCGITGWVDYVRDLTRERDTALAMTRTLQRRGPDDEGVWSDIHVALGHRRLAVIDAPGGVQPMTAEAEGRALAVIAYNGETYNFRQLRRELQSHGHTFRTRSDTEVVLHAYLQWGLDFVHHLVGMFAIAIWDARSQELVLVRDHVGIKPLFYAPTAHGVLFGSEQKAILAHPHFSPRVDEEGIAELLTNMKTPGFGVFQGMREVRPGHLVRVSRSGYDELRYWELEAREHPDDLPTTVTRVRDLLEEIVSGQLVSDVPLGTLLSGGLDSSAVTALVARTLDREGADPVRTFSVDFIDETGGFVPDDVRATQDAPFAAALAAHVNAKHTEVVLGTQQLTAPVVTDSVTRARDLPNSGDIDNSLLLLLAEVRRHCTVALSGEGADELFGGYLWFHDEESFETDTFPWTVGSVRSRLGRLMLDPDYVSRVALPHIDRRYREAISEVSYLPGERLRERRIREISYLNLTRMLQMMLDRKDRMSMAVGLEVRVPFCDHRLIDYVFNAPWAFKASEGREKSLLRRAVADLLPVSVAQRVKVPYPTMQNPSYERDLRRRVLDTINDSNAPIRPYIDLTAMRAAATGPLKPVSMRHERMGLERVVAVNDWLTTYRPALV
ncbi:asparagine synthase (glutamine-hydrolyzing) [Streptomyces sp. NPDC002677]|uniref:asparagine synthase (glutamine-hydrolyzing) n=1 Tax=Streptomyces sp. NPDC002677 TaxID=3154774 RepID=UPI00331B0339